MGATCERCHGDRALCPDCGAPPCLFHAMEDDCLHPELVDCPVCGPDLGDARAKFEAALERMNTSGRGGIIRHPLRLVRDDDQPGTA